MQEKPKIPKGDVDAYVKNHDEGVELTFTDERALDVKAGREYPEGALVLSNIRFYGAPTNDFKIFNGILPMSLSFGDIKEKLLEKLMSPAWLNSKQSSMRWDFEGYCLFCDFDADQKLDTICIQLPLQ